MIITRFRSPWGRYLFQSIFMSFVIFGIGRKSPAILRTHRPGVHAVRAFFSWVSNIPFIVALIFIPLADATAAALVRPLIVTALSVPFLGERVGIWRWSAVVVGMVGALIVVRPGMGVMHWAITLPIVSATTFALYTILTRKISAPLIGLIVYGEFPDRWTIVGAIINCASGIFIALRERQKSRALAPQ